MNKKWVENLAETRGFMICRSESMLSTPRIGSLFIVIGLAHNEGFLLTHLTEISKISKRFPEVFYNYVDF